MAAAKNSKNVDLEDIIKRWAKNYFEDKSNSTRKERSLLKIEAAVMDIDWKRVKFVHDPVDYKRQPLTSGSGSPKSQVLFNTTFTNRSTQPQSFSFRTERTTRSSCTVEVEQGYVAGVELNVKLSTPCEIMEVNAGFKREIALTNLECQTVEEELTWGVDNQILVEPRHVAEARLVVEEEEYNGAFEVTTRVSGVVRVVMRNLKNNNAFMKAIERRVADIVKEDDTLQKSDAFSVEGSTIIIRTKGKCLFRYGIRQTVEVDQQPIN